LFSTTPPAEKFQRKDTGQAPTGLEVLENRVATKIPLLSAFAAGCGVTAPKRPAATVCACRAATK